MAFCNQCGHENAANAKFCGECGAAMADGAAPASEPAKSGLAKIPKRKKILIFGMSTVLWIAIGSFVAFGPNSCSSTEGTVTASGDTLGNITLTPTVCSSGEHESFFGVVLAGETDKQARVKIVKDPVKDYAVLVGLPGTCSGNDCKYVPIDKRDCGTHAVKVVETTTRVNRIYLVDGSLKLDCELGKSKATRGKQQGALRADVKFESCD